MLSFFEPLRKLCRVERVAIDNGVFRLHYKVTVIMFILGSVLLNGKQYFGDPIECHLDSGIPAKIVSTFCWITGTFTLQGESSIPRHFYAHQGVGGPAAGRKVYHRYYQWVGFILFFQAILFYLPRHLWKMYENGNMKFLTQNMADPEISDEAREQRVKRLRALFQKFTLQPQRNRNYALKFYLFEFINLANVIGQIFLINMFLGGKFLTYGPDAYDFYHSVEGEDDPMSDVFPKVTKCTFRTHSIVADIIDHDAICVLPLNIVNEKVYLVMWFWLIILAILSSAAVLYRAAAIMFPPLRTLLLFWTGNHQWKHVANACRSGQYGDWFLLRQMSKNVDRETFDEFLQMLSKESGLYWDTNSNPTRTCTMVTKPSSWAGGFFNGQPEPGHGEPMSNNNLGGKQAAENKAFGCEENDLHIP